MPVETQAPPGGFSLSLAGTGIWAPGCISCRDPGGYREDCNRVKE